MLTAFFIHSILYEDHLKESNVNKLRNSIFKRRIKVYKMILQFWPKNKRSDIEMIRRYDIIIGKDMFSI